jgi:uncharacterized protein (TIGR00299 family) protein
LSKAVINYALKVNVTSGKFVIFGLKNRALMKVLYYDCFAGISGDMNLAALIDLGVPQNYLLQELKKLNIEGYEITVSRALKMGISGTKVDITLTGQQSHHHEHSHDYHRHQDHISLHHHEPRNFKAIRAIIEESPLNSFVKEKSIAIFNEIAVAEAKIHAKPIDEIHFHEVGAIDSIVDIAGAAICIEYLKPDRIMASSIELGGGFVECAHGTFPVPAPATAEILKNIPVKLGKVDKETTTPTGAAILKVFVDEFTDSPHLLIGRTAYGVGHYDLAVPNVLRVYFGELTVDPVYKNANALIVECNIDDMNPEHYSYIMDALFEAGAQDVFIIPVIMKKSRPAAQLTVLCDVADRDKVEHLLLKETTSLGVRYMYVTKSMLERNSLTIQTPYGPIRIKEGLVNGEVVKHKAEFDDCAKAARQAGVKLSEVYAAVEKSINSITKKG